MNRTIGMLLSKFILSIFILCLFQARLGAQINYTGAIESSGLLNKITLVRVDPGPGWRGYYLEDAQQGFSISTVHGIAIKHHVFIGLGLSYLNFQGIHGYSIFGNFNYQILKRKVSPLIGMKLGSSHIYNQYDSGTRTPFFELNGGFNVYISEKQSLYMKSGITVTQQCSFIPITLGYQF